MTCDEGTGIRFRPLGSGTGTPEPVPPAHGSGTRVMEPEPGTGTIAVPEPDPDPEPATGSLRMELPGGTLPGTTRLVLAARAWAAGFRPAGRGGLMSGLWRAQPESLAQHAAYAASRAARPGTSPGLRRAEAIYHATAGRAGIAAGNTISALAARPSRALTALIVTALIIVITAIAH